VKSLGERFSLDGRAAFVSGGAGRYGRQIVQALAEAGARVYIGSHNAPSREADAAGHRAMGRDVRVLPFDQGDEASITAAADVLRRESGILHVIVNNAVERVEAAGLSASVPSLDRSFHVNAAGLIAATRILAELLADGGSIINIGSIMGLVGPEPSNYRETTLSGWYPDYFYNKGGMASLTRFLASFYGPRGIRVNCVHPGGLQSEAHPPAFVRQYSERTCLGRLANDSDLMGIVAFLASDASAYVTGANIPVDGGYTAK
jgi:NAD(P)-dependent dehydrogenase (short-subunit alcohol dehydrogenase family)